MRTLRYIPVDKLRFTEKKRRGICPRRVAELVRELELRGELHPIRADPIEDGCYVIRDGRHRVKAHIALGIPDILALV